MQTRFCSSKTDWVTNFWLSGILSGQFGKNLSCWLTQFFDQLFFWQLIYETTDFLTTKFCDSLSNYLTYLLRVWDSRPLVLFFLTIWMSCWKCKLLRYRIWQWNVDRKLSKVWVWQLTSNCCHEGYVNIQKWSDQKFRQFCKFFSPEGGVTTLGGFLLTSDNF